LESILILCSDAGKALVLRAIKNHKEETSTRTVSEISTKTDVKTMPSILMFLRETSTSMPSTDPMDPTMDQEISTTLVPSIMDQEISTTLPSMDPMDPTMDQEISTTLVPSTMDQEISTTLPSMDPLMDQELSTTLVPSMDPTMDQEISTTLPSMDLTMDPTMDQEMISEISMDPKTMPSILVDHKEISTHLAPREVTLKISTLPLEDLNRDQITSMDLNKIIVEKCKRRFSCSIVKYC